MTKKVRYYRILLIILLLPLGLMGQVKKAENLVEDKRYLDAIEVYENAIKKSPSGFNYNALGNLYQKTKQYTKAKEAFSKALTFSELTETRYIDYAKICLQTEDFDEAKKYFELYEKESKGDYRAELYVKSINEIVNWKKESVAWEISSVEGINSTADEFCPKRYKNGPYNYIFL